jgi:large subunit ribosomal protein L25
MKTIEIQGNKRNNLTKQTVKALRNDEQVPCVLYGGDAEPLHFSASLAAFKPLVYTPDVHLVKLVVDGQERQCILQDIQFHPVTDVIQHVDFMAVSNDKPVTIQIPIRLTGASEGVKQGGKLVTKVRKLKVKAMPAHLPDNINIDITPLKIGGDIRVRDISVDGVTFLDAPSNVVVGVRTTRNVVAAEGSDKK